MLGKERKYIVILILVVFTDVVPITYLDVNRYSTITEDGLCTQDQTEHADAETLILQGEEEFEPLTVHLAVNCK